MALAAPVAARAADPAVEDLAVLTNSMASLSRSTRSASLGSRFVEADLVTDLVGHRHHLAGVVGQGRLGHEDDVLAVVAAAA